MEAAGPSLAHCRNCGAPAPDRFCPRCGQTTRLHPPSVREFMAEFVGHHVALEGRLAVTLATLLFHPGRLAADYFAGRRERYIAPLRLYLTFSVVFFLALGIIGPGKALKIHTATADPTHDPQINIVIARDADEEAALAEARERAADVKSGLAAVDLRATSDSAAGRLAKARLKRFAALTPDEQAARIRENVQHDGPYLVFCMVPVLALWSLWAYRSRHRFYAEHLVQALHIHTVGLMLMTLCLVPWDIGWVLFVILLIYVTLAYRRVFGGRLVATLARIAFMGAGYAVSLTCAFVALLVFSLLT